MFELQGAWAPGDHLGLMLNGALAFQRDDSLGRGGSGQLLEAGLGYFSPLDDHFVFETYGLLGLGAMENHFPLGASANTVGNIQAPLLKFGLQPALGFKSRFFDAAISLRMAGLRYLPASGNLVSDGADQVQYLDGLPLMFLAEPALTVRAGYRFVKLQAQLGSSFNLTDPAFPQGKEYLSLGLVFCVDK